MLFDAKKVRSESGIVDVDPAPAMEVISWPADSVKPSIGLQGQVHLDVHMGACSIQLGFGEKQLQELIKALNALATPIKPIKKASSTPDKKPAKSIVEKKVKSETIKPSAKTQPLKAKVPPRAVTKAKSVKK